MSTATYFASDCSKTFSYLSRKKNAFVFRFNITQNFSVFLFFTMRVFVLDYMSPLFLITLVFCFLIHLFSVWSHMASVLLFLIPHVFYLICLVFVLLFLIPRAFCLISCGFLSFVFHYTRSINIFMLLISRVFCLIAYGICFCIILLHVFSTFLFSIPCISCCFYSPVLHYTCFYIPVLNSTSLVLFLIT